MRSDKNHVPPEFISEFGLSGAIAISGLNHFLLCVKDVSFKEKRDGNRLG